MFVERTEGSYWVLRVLSWMYVASMWLGCFRRIRKISKSTISFAVSLCIYMCVHSPVCPSAWKKLGSHWMDFHENVYLSIFRKPIETIQFWLKSVNSNRYFTWTSLYIYDNMSPKFSWSEKCIRNSCRENRNTHFIFSYLFQKIVPSMR